MATHSSILAWEIPWTEEPGGLQSIGSQRVEHDLATKQNAATAVVKTRTGERHLFFLMSIHTIEFFF